MESVKQIPDGSVESIIRELFEQGRAVTGVSVRQELRKRFGKPGGVSRIYRVIQATLPQLRRATTPVATESEQQLLDEISYLKGLVVEANAARDHAERQEEYWIMQVDAMRQRVGSSGRNPLALSQALPLQHGNRGFTGPSSHSSADVMEEEFPEL